MTNAELGILSLVAEKPYHGYEMEQIIEKRGMRNWTEIGFSSIYYLLRKLEQQGYIASRLESAGRGPARKVYTITQTGAGAYREGVLEALSTHHQTYPSIQLGLAGLPAVQKEDALAALRLYRKGLLERSSQAQKARGAQLPLPDHVEIMFDYSLTMIKAEIEWVDRIITQMEQQ